MVAIPVFSLKIQQNPNKASALLGFCYLRREQDSNLRIVSHNTLSKRAS